MKTTLSSPERDSIGCLLKLKRTYVNVQYHGTARSGVMSLQWNKKEAGGGLGGW